MNSNFIDQEPKLMMSDSLQDVVDDEAAAKMYEEMFITTALVTEAKENSLIGSLVGVDLAIQTKIDLKVSLGEAFNFLSNVLLNDNNRKLRTIIMNLGDKVTQLSGPFNITSTKIVEIDPSNKTCVLAVDLIKDVP
jgi:transcription antitermination factor NusG